MGGVSPLAKDHELAATVQVRAQYYLGQQYNWLFHATRLVGKHYRVTHSFCSELVARVFADLGEPFYRGYRVEPQNLFPTDIASETQGEDWENVTEEYRRFLEGAGPTVVEQMVNDLLRQAGELEVPWVDPRLTYIRILTLGFKSLMSQKEINEGLIDLLGTMETIRTTLKTTSKDGQRSLLIALGVDPRSFKAIYSNLLTIAFGADADFSDKKREDAIEDFSVFQQQ
jgi:hypothetical protein